MPNWIVEACGRCGSEAQFIHTGPEWKRRYCVRCDADETHCTRPYLTGREAVKRWNDAQRNIYDGCGSNSIEWINKYDRMPGEDDADAYGCVMIWDRLNGARITGWRNAQELGREAVTHWAVLPEGPGR